MRMSSMSTVRAVSSQACVDLRLLEQLFDYAHDMAFYVKDTQGRYVVVNRSLLERHGLQQREQWLDRFRTAQHGS